MPSHVAPAARRRRAPRTDSNATYGREQEELDRDELLRARLGGFENIRVTGEAPHDDRAREALDRGVDAEADQRDRAGQDAGEDRDRRPRPSSTRGSARTAASRGGPAAVLRVVRTAPPQRSQRGRSRARPPPRRRAPSSARRFGDSVHDHLAVAAAGTRPAPRSTRRWCETRFSARSATQARSHTHSSSVSAERRRERQARRVAERLGPLGEHASPQARQPRRRAAAPPSGGRDTAGHSGRRPCAAPYQHLNGRPDVRSTSFTGLFPERLPYAA